MPSAVVKKTITPAISGYPNSEIEQGRSLLGSFGDRLQWLPDLGLGWFPVRAQPYDEDYFEKYRALDNTPIGDRLAFCRLAFVLKHWRGSLVDVGIGGGRFVLEHRDARGYDVNPHAIRWLQRNGFWIDPRRSVVDAATFWDSLEHIHDPREILCNVRRWVFVSLPIFRDVEHVLTSKHYKPQEHCWYFTREGFLKFMRMMGFRCERHSKMEQIAGREDIESFAFERASQ